MSCRFAGWVFALASLVWMLGVPALAADPVVIYSTGFEKSEGFDSQFTLAGQDGWVGEGSGGNGLVADWFRGKGQQAFIGFFSPTNREAFLNVWRPVNLAPVPADQKKITFSVMMEVGDSTNQRRDAFRWSIYNHLAVRLFSVDFNNETTEVRYGLENTPLRATGSRFQRGGQYLLIIDMDFARNLWSATLEGVPIIQNQPISTEGSALTLGDIDAVWEIFDETAPGDNYMIFDDYRITATPGETGHVLRLELANRTPEGHAVIRLFGQPGERYAVEASSDLVQWTQVTVQTIPAAGMIEVRDTAAPNFTFRFYRARSIASGVL